MKIDVNMTSIKNAKEEQILVAKDGKWYAVPKKDFLEAEFKKQNEINDLKIEFKNFKAYHKHFIKYAKSHFQVVFNAFKLKALTGEIEVEDEELLTLDDKVASGELSVEQALEKHEFLKTRFEFLFGDDKQAVEFPEL